VTRYTPLLSLCFVSACTGDATGPEGALEKALAHARPAAVDSDASGGATSINSASRTEARLILTFVGAQGRHSLAIERRIDRDRARFRVSDARAYTSPAVADPKVDSIARDRVETIFDGRGLAWRRGDGTWIERDVLDGLAQRTLANAADLADFTLGAFADYLRSQPLAPGEGRPENLAGNRVVWTSIDLDPAVRPRALNEAELTTLRDHDPTVAAWVAATHRPNRIQGEVARNDKGVVIAARVTIEAETPAPEGLTKFTLELTQTIAVLPSDATFELPADRLPESRERPWQMIEDVLGTGLLPPYKAP